MANKKFKKQNVLGFMTETAKLNDDSLIKNNLQISAELEPYIFPLTTDEFNQLEANILQEGCRDPLVYWKKGDLDFILIDGHNRFKICSKHNIDFKLEQKDFDSIANVKDWMINNQLGRRNLTPEQSAILRGRLYNQMKQAKVIERGPKGQFVPSVNSSEKLATTHRVSEKTIKRDGLFADGMQAIKTLNGVLYSDILSRKEKVKRSDIEKLGKIVRSDEHFTKNLIVKSVQDIVNSVSQANSKSSSVQTDIDLNMEKLLKHAEKLKILGIGKAEIKGLIDQLFKK